MTIVFTTQTSMNPQGNVNGGLRSAGEEIELCGKDIVSVPEQVFKAGSSLKSLNLCNNVIGREANAEPNGWNSLQNLVALNLSANELKEWPQFLAVLRSLQVLSLSGNEMETMPDTIKEFPKLTRLHLDFNRLKRIPLDWSTVNNLTTLTLSNNQLEEVPASIWSLHSLKKLDLRRNNISTVGISPLKVVKQLNELLLSHNRIRGCLDLSPIMKLETLDVSNNTIQLLEVTVLDRLRFIDCSYNNLKMLKLHATNLCTLHASNNDLDAIFCNHSPSSLETIDVSHNSLSELPCWILLCKRLKNLLVHHNLISKIIDGLLCSSTNNLQAVELNHNLLDKLPDSVSNCSVKELYLQYNRLNCIPDHFFAKFSNLEILNLSYNYLQLLPSTAKCPRLKILLLTGNQLTDVTTLNSLSKQMHLSTLFLSNNTIKDIPDNLFSNCSSLENLSLCCNQLLKIPSQITKNKNLRKLYLHSNKLKAIPPLKDMSELQVLDVACNDLNEMELCTIVPKNLIYLDLSANKNIHIDPMEFQNLCCNRSVAVVDANSAGTNAHKQHPPGTSNNNNNQEKMPWCLGFTETEEGNTRLYVELQKDDPSGQREALLALLAADNNHVVTQLRQILPAFLKAEMECEETSQHYLRNVLLSCVRYLRTNGYSRQLGITICHMTSSAGGGSTTINLATIGRPSSCILGRAGSVIILAQKEESTPTDANEWNQVMKSSDLDNTTELRHGGGSFPPKGSWSSIPDPEVRELVLSSQDKFLVFGSNDFARIMPAEQVCRIVQISGSSVSAAKALSEEYAAVTNGRRECVAVITFQSPEREDGEKYRCWEFMLEQNHKLLFTKELETIHRTILRDPASRVIGGDPSSWYNSAFLKYRCPLPSHRGRYYCYGTKVE